MVIPLDLATDQKQVSLGTLRRVGSSGAAGVARATRGGHAIVLLGMAATRRGRRWPLGCIIYRVEVDGQVEAKKTTKLP